MVLNGFFIGEKKKMGKINNFIYRSFRSKDNNSRLHRFVSAQKKTFDIALSEIRSGKKKTHWMWFIYPQIAGLGNSLTARYYAIHSLSEADAYLRHPVLGYRLRLMTAELLKLDKTDPYDIFGFPDYLKLKSCMTLFEMAEMENSTLFSDVLVKFFGGQRDDKTIFIVKKTQKETL